MSKQVTKSAKTINLLLLDDHDMFREGLARTLEREPDLKVVGQCSSSAEALAMLNRSVHMVLLDVDLGNERALRFVEEARKADFDGQILVVTAGISGQEAVRLLQSGVTGILHKRHSGEVLCDSIRKLAAGESCLEGKYLTSLIQSVDRTRTTVNPKLTDRDRALIRHLLEGLTNREIGIHLEISEGAVKASLRLLFEKLNVRSRTQLVQVALKQYQDQL
jgi:two-component system, NarL family, nitrate/nitrite response regulator NarL